MIEMTPAARERLDSYLQRMRSELRGTRSVAADEVEESVREHIEVALAHTPGPVGAPEMIGVLDRLGPPERWVAEEDRSLWRQFASRLGDTPGEWRLAYLVFGLFLASLLLFQLIGPLLILPAMLASRAYVELARERSEPLGARRWLVYPPIALVLLFALFLLIIGPPLRLLDYATSESFAQMLDVPANMAAGPRFMAGAGAVVFGAWWIVAGAFCAAFLRPIRFVFAPLVDNIHRRHFSVLAGIGALVAAGGATLIRH